MSIQDKGNSSKKFSPAVSGRLMASKLFALSGILIAIAAISANSLRPEQTFFIDYPSGQTREVFPLKEPNVTPTSLVNWITQAVTSAYTLDFFNYQDNIDNMKQYFTNDGYKSYLAALNRNGNLDTIIADKLIVSAVAIDTAVILQEGIINGVYSWKIQLPILLNYQGASTTSTKKTIVVNALVNRLPTDLASKGIGIAQIVDEDYYA